MQHSDAVFFAKREGLTTLCDSCGEAELDSVIHVYVGKKMNVCPDCDLPEGWCAKWSSTRGRYYFFNTAFRKRQWGHPNPSNPLHVPHEEGEIFSRKRKFKDEHPLSLENC